MNKISKKDILGNVLASDINENIIKMEIKNPNDERVKKNINVVVQTELNSNSYKLYYCVIENITQMRSDSLKMIINNSNIEEDDYEYDNGDVDFEHSGLNENKGISFVASLICFKTIYYENKEISKSEQFLKPPNGGDIIRLPTEKEYIEIVSHPKWKNYWTGTLVNNDSVFVPINYERLLEVSCGIFGKTRSGKSVTTRNIIKTIITDKDNLLDTSVIIFDMMNEYAVNTHSSKKGDLGLCEYPQLKDKITILGLDNLHASNNGLCRKNENGQYSAINGYDYREFFIFKDNVDARDVLMYLSKDATFSDKMRATVYAMDDESVRRRRRNEQHASFYDVMEEFYTEGFEKGENGVGGSLGYRLSNKEDSYFALRWRIKDFVNENGMFIQNKFIRDRIPGERDSLEYLISYLDYQNEEFDVEDAYGNKKKKSKSFVIYFGSLGSYSAIYEFIANIITFKLYKTYTGNSNIKIMKDGQSVLRFKKVVINIEECHKFIGEGIKNPIMESLARELRKMGLTLMLVDQMPSLINKEIMAQLENIIIHQMRNDEDISSVLKGYGAEYKYMVRKLNVGEGLYLGNMLDMPSFIKSFFLYDNDDIRKEYDLRFPTDENVAVNKKKKIVDNSKKIKPLKFG